MSWCCKLNNTAEMWDNSASESLQVEDERQETDHQYNMVTTADFFVSVLFWSPLQGNLYITKSSVKRTISFTPVMAKYMNKKEPRYNETWQSVYQTHFDGPLALSLYRGSTVLSSHIAENIFRLTALSSPLGVFPYVSHIDKCRHKG